MAKLSRQSLLAKVKHEEVSKKSQVYCDNEILQKKILDAKPSKDGLYPHELIMIFYSSIDHLKTANTIFSSLLKYQFAVKYPSLLLESLISRGYIRICTNEEILNHLKTPALRELMKHKELKCKDKSNAENMRETIKQNYSSDEIFNYLNFLYYIPTTKGEEELNDNQHIVKDRSKGWQTNCGYGNKKYINAKDIDIKKIDCSKFELHIEREKCTFNIFSHEGIKEAVIEWVRYFPKGSKISIIVDKKILLNDVPVDIIYFLRNVKKVILCNTINEKCIDCTCYDFQTNMVVFKEKISDHLISSMPKDQYEYARKIDSLDGVIEGDFINYFVSIQNVLAYYVLLESLKEYVTLVKLDNYLQDDHSPNYKISVDVDDSYTRNIVMYMIINKMLDLPVVKDVSMKIVIEYLRKKSSSKTHQTLMDNEMEPHIYECKIVDEVRKSISSNWEEVFTLFTKTYPKRIFCYCGFACYSSNNIYFKDENWLEVKNNYPKWHTEFITLVKELKLQGIIQPRWINEFSLYVIADTFFSDVIYQYRNKWLGDQSLDIFIPSIKVGIEYQGIQHYVPVNYFKGKEGFEKRKKLDERKKKLCEKKGIILIEWPYTIDVTENNFAEMLNKNGIKKKTIKNQNKLDIVTGINPIDEVI